MTDYDQRSRAIRSLASALAEGADRASMRASTLRLLDVMPLHLQVGDVPHGLLDEAQASSPLLSPEIDKLMREHGDLLGRLRRLAERISAEPDRPSELARGEARALALLVLEHEERVARLFTAAG